MPRAAVLMARELLLAGRGEFREVQVHTFQNDEAAHDDDIQEGIRREFITAFTNILAELTAEFGEPSRSGDQHDGPIPLNGVFRFAFWSVGGNELYLATAHEDRELPYLLILGTM